MLVGILLQFVVCKSLSHPALRVIWAVLIEVDLGTQCDLHRLGQPPSCRHGPGTPTHVTSMAAVQVGGVRFPFLFGIVVSHPHVLLSAAVVVQSLSRVRLFVTPRTAALQASLSFTVSRSLLKLMSIELMMPSNCLILCCPLLLLPSIFPQIRVFSNELALCIKWTKCWSFSFSISPSNESSGLISFRTDWFELLGVHGTLKSLLQHHSLKASVHQC